MTQSEEHVISDAKVAAVDMKLEVIVIPVSDVDRAKDFYGRLGWRLDAGFRFDNGFRVVQITPPGSGYSIQFGTKVTAVAPGSAQKAACRRMRSSTARLHRGGRNGERALLNSIELTHRERKSWRRSLPGNGVLNTECRRQSVLTFTLLHTARHDYRSNCASAIFATCLSALRSELSLAMARMP